MFRKREITPLNKGNNKITELRTPKIKFEVKH